jgi:hypothetical protein
MFLRFHEILKKNNIIFKKGLFGIYTFFSSELKKKEIVIRKLTFDLIFYKLQRMITTYKSLLTDLNAGFQIVPSSSLPRELPFSCFCSNPLNLEGYRIIDKALFYDFDQKNELTVRDFLVFSPDD